jgi:hypothetical protein
LVFGTDEDEPRFSRPERTCIVVTAVEELPTCPMIPDMVLLHPVEGERSGLSEIHGVAAAPSPGEAKFGSMGSAVVQLEGQPPAGVGPGDADPLHEGVAVVEGV